MERRANPAGNYDYATGISPYSAGVRAHDGYMIVRCQLGRAVPWQQGFEEIDRVLAAEGRGSSALCSIELRCPKPHSFDGFGSFNDDYRTALSDRGILLSDGENPVARTNVAPSFVPAEGTELHAFGITIERSADAVATAGRAAPPSFVISGAGDLYDQADLRPEAIVGGAGSWADTGSERAGVVLGEMETRLSALGLSWSDSDDVVVYSVEEVGGVVAAVLQPALGPAARRGVHWHQARPPLTGLRFEMDTRGGVIERRLDVG